MSASVTVKDVSAQAFIAAYAAHLKREGKLELPKNPDLIKSGTSRALSPMNNDWFYVRTAAIARRVYLNPGTGVGGLRMAFGNSKNNGVRPSHFTKAAGGNLRHALQQLQKLKLIESTKEGGRRISPEGQRSLDLVARSCIGK
eukprot:c5525_g1_i1.p1 GENE.c5525_g1_i1~~c5525_g1_i1.p1  ORF type:complete len:143 (-),score=12.98 c5525_g1_i1:11-439(-)